VEYQGVQRCNISLNWESPFTTIKRKLFCISRCNSAVCDMSNLEGKKPPPISVAPKVLSQFIPQVILFLVSKQLYSIAFYHRAILLGQCGQDVMFEDPLCHVRHGGISSYRNPAGP
jgi:hypothetical protein